MHIYQVKFFKYIIHRYYILAKFDTTDVHVRVTLVRHFDFSPHRPVAYPSLPDAINGHHRFRDFDVIRFRQLLGC
jgi:hypothetical protein